MIGLDTLFYINWLYSLNPIGVCDTHVGLLNTRGAGTQNPEYRACRIPPAYLTS